MAEINIVPFQNGMTITVGADGYTGHLRRAEFVPTQPKSSWTGLDGVEHTFAGKSGWVLELEGAQDWDTVNALSQYLNAHEGEKIDVTLGVPGGSFDAEVTAGAVNIGGVVNTPAVFAVQLTSSKPAFTAAP